MKLRPFAFSLVLATSLLVAVPAEIDAQSSPQLTASPTETVISSSNNNPETVAFELNDWLTGIVAIFAILGGITGFWSAYRRYNEKQLVEFLNAFFAFCCLSQIDGNHKLNYLTLKKSFKDSIEKAIRDDGTFDSFVQDFCNKFLENFKSLNTFDRTLDPFKALKECFKVSIEKDTDVKAEIEKIIGHYVQGSLQSTVGTQIRPMMEQNDKLTRDIKQLQKDINKLKEENKVIHEKIEKNCAGGA